VKPYHELHITYMGGPAPVFDGWSQSMIHGDIILGEGPKRYLTRHASSKVPLDLLIYEMEQLAGILRTYGRTVLRTKVELVLYDKRTP